MIKNYLTTALRSTCRNKLYASLNVAGLAVGIASCMLILLFVQDELSYDRYHEKADRIYRVNTHINIKDRDMHFGATAHVQGPMLQAEFPEIENHVRFSDYGSQRIIRYGEKQFSEDKFIWTDPSCFEIFSWKLLQGDAGTALVRPNTVVITEEVARKYFAEENPIGRSLRVHNDTMYEVTGVVANIPKNSHFKPDFFASFSTLKLEPTGNSAEDMLSNIDYVTFLLLRRGADPGILENKIAGYVEKHLGPVLENLGGTISMTLQPLPTVYLHSEIDAELERTGDVAYVYLFSAIGIFILILACLNFMNLSTARYSHRAREVGLRKVMGAGRGQLIKQFLGESLVLTALSVLFSFGLLSLLLPVFRNMSNKDISIGSFSNPFLWVGLLGLAAVIGLAGGSYPAFFLSSFRPVEVLQSKIRKAGGRSLMRVVLVTFQFTVSIVLIIGTLVVHNQLTYVGHKKLGYHRDHILSLTIRNPETQKSMEVLKNELSRHPRVIHAAASRTLPLGTNGFTAYHVEDKPANELTMFFVQIVDGDYLDVFGMTVQEGRNFSEAFAQDRTDSVMVNRAAMKKLGWLSGAEGKIIERFTGIDARKPYRVIGVVSDYHFQSLHEEIQPLILHNAPPWEQTEGGDFNRLSLRLRPGNIEETMAFIRSKWREIDPQYPFEYSFLNDQYDNLYRNEKRLEKLFGYFTLLAILIGSLGLFGLTSFTAEQRRKEIGIRKVLGATVPGVVLLLLKETTKWILLAVVFAWPIGYLIMTRWLENFAYRIGLGPDLFLVAAFLAVSIAVVTVSYQTVRAALASPVNNLKYE